MDTSAKIVITGAAGLVGQNLVLMLREHGYSNVVAIDKHAANLALLAHLNPGVRTVLADLAEPGHWAAEFQDTATAVVLHAQITGKTAEPFLRNNVQASEHVFAAIAKHAVPFTVHVSSSVVNSVADDDYTRTKRTQEKLYIDSGLPGCMLRPTLMYGWFDPKHFGWLAQFMQKVPVFPIPGHGRYMRQPLYERDFCRVILWCVTHRPIGQRYDLVGSERVDYIDIIRLIREAKGLKTPLLHVPVQLFSLALRAYSLFSSQPPFTASQLKALTAGDDFSGVDIQDTFGFRPTGIKAGLLETFRDSRYADIAVARVD
jgi:uncharacterized protein YbjT (DUF2867 family)